MIIFAGERNPQSELDTTVYWWGMNTPPAILDLSNNGPVNHSPTGFEWGYNGSGPAQLAYAILLWYLWVNSPYDWDKCESIAARWHQEFKDEFVISLPKWSWQLSGESIYNWLLLKGVIEYE